MFEVQVPQNRSVTDHCVLFLSVLKMLLF